MKYRMLRTLVIVLTLLALAMPSAQAANEVAVISNVDISETSPVDYLAKSDGLSWGTANLFGGTDSGSSSSPAHYRNLSYLCWHAGTVSYSAYTGVYNAVSGSAVRSYNRAYINESSGVQRITLNYFTCSSIYKSGETSLFLRGSDGKIYNVVGVYFNCPGYQCTTVTGTSIEFRDCTFTGIPVWMADLTMPIKLVNCRVGCELPADWTQENCTIIQGGVVTGLPGDKAINFDGGTLIINDATDTPALPLVTGTAGKVDVYKTPDHGWPNISAISWDYANIHSLTTLPFPFVQHGFTKINLNTVQSGQLPDKEIIVPYKSFV